ncbi:unnamed protein product, partial [Adineta ricciae]
EQNLPTKRVDLPSTSFSSQKPDFNQTHTQSTEEPIVNENSSVPPVAGSVDTNTAVKSASHNVTYTEIIHSESLDGEQSRRFMTESYDEQPSALDDNETTSRKIITKSEFSNHPSLGEKIMEQSVQVITVKVRNETITTTNSSPTSDKSSLPHDTHPTNTTL